MRIAIASDQAGHEAMKRLAAKLSGDGCDVVYPASSLGAQERTDYAEQLALAVLRNDADRGIILTSRAVGASVAANRVPGIRAALCNDAYSAQLGAQTEGMNVLVLALHSLDEEHAHNLVQAYLQATLAPVEITGGLTPRRLQRVFEHVREHVAEALSVGELAQVVGMSQYYFSKLFKLSTGTTPHQYVMRQRVEHAQEMLREGSLPLVEVGVKAGFETQSHFTSVFRHLVGVTPKRYRDMQRAMSPMDLAVKDQNARAEQQKEQDQQSENAA